jgi:hemerythrin
MLSGKLTEFLLKWSAAYATGIEHLDNQHRMLFQMSEDFRAALDEGKGEQVYGSLLRSLHLYAGMHFGLEEQCMERYRCPVAHNNCVAHAKFIEALMRFQQRYEEHTFERAIAGSLVDFLDQWLGDHIGRIDVQIKPYVERQPG